MRQPSPTIKLMQRKFTTYVELLLRKVNAIIPILLDIIKIKMKQLSKYIQASKKVNKVPSIKWKILSIVRDKTTSK